jgi:[ribosomal protein S5]-alanine N-acetyltransferase
MKAIESFRTDRLVAAPLRPEDFADLRRLHGDPRVMATLSADGRPLPEEETRRALQRHLGHWERHGYGLWAFRDPTDGRFVGYCGLKHTEVGGNDEIELAYAVVADEWGQGLATEMAEAVLRVGFEHLGLTEVVCFTLTTNRASQRVMEKAGFAYEREIVHAGLPHVLYRLTAGEWRNARASRPSGPDRGV